MDWNGVIYELVRDGERLFLLLGAGLLLFWMVLSVVSKSVSTLARERTKREIAAYIAEGSMSPEQGERLLKAGKKPTDGGD